MAATKTDIRGWFQYGIKKGATHMLVICDTYDYEDYPRYVMPGENPRDADPKGDNMQRTMECYDLRMDMDEQLAERRAFHWEV